MYRFATGDVLLLWSNHSTNPLVRKLAGKLVQVQDLKTGPNGYQYLIKLEGYKPTWVLEEYLAPYEGQHASNWTECAWKPKGLRPAGSPPRWP